MNFTEVKFPKKFTFGSESFDILESFMLLVAFCILLFLWIFFILCWFIFYVYFYLRSFCLIKISYCLFYFIFDFEAYCSLFSLGHFGPFFILWSFYFVMFFHNLFYFFLVEGSFLIWHKKVNFGFLSHMESIIAPRFDFLVLRSFLSLREWFYIYLLSSSPFILFVFLVCVSLFCLFLSLPFVLSLSLWMLQWQYLHFHLILSHFYSFLPLTANIRSLKYKSGNTNSNKNSLINLIN